MFPLACRSAWQRRMVHAALQWEAVQAVAAQGALGLQVADVADPQLSWAHQPVMAGFLGQQAQVEQTVLYHSFIDALIYSRGALRGSPWLELVAPMLVKHFQVRMCMHWRCPCCCTFWFPLLWDPSSAAAMKGITASPCC